MRYDTEEELMLLNELYVILRLYTNFFQPTMKLVEKIRTGSKVTKKYDRAKTPYQRVLDSSIEQEDKKRLKEQYATLNPVALKDEITRLQNQLIKSVAQKMRKQRSLPPNDLEYILCEATRG